MLAQEGAALESVGSAGCEVGCCWVPPSLCSLLSTPMKGEVGRRGEGCANVAPACLSLPSIPREGEMLRQGEGCRVIAESFDHPAAPSAQGGGSR
jgi:hypothetical protein